MGGWGLNTLFLSLHGGVNNINWTTFLVLIGGASWMLGQRVTIAMTVLTAGLYSLAAWADGRGWVGPPAKENLLIAGFYFWIMFGLTAAMGLLARRSYRLRIDRERRISAELKVREGELRKLSQVIEQSPESIMIADLQGRIEYANPTALQRLQCEAGEVLGQQALLLGATRLPPDALASMRVALDTGQAWTCELRSPQADGSECIETARVTALRQSDGHITHHVWLRQDITARREAEERLLYLAHHDALTDLPNRAQLERHLARRLQQRSGQEQSHFALLHLNIDRFKTINEARGQAVGDALLRAVAGMLRQAAGRAQAVARLGADEFAMLLSHLDPDPTVAGHQAFAAASRLHETLLSPVPLPTGDHVTVTASVGIALGPLGLEDTPLDVLRRAATALNQAKSQGGAQTAFFEVAMGEAAQRRFRVERELRTAVVDHQFRLFLQPQVNAQGMWAGAEALLRWQHPTRGLVPPGEFIPIAEESDLIVGLGRWVFTEAVRLIEREAAAGRTLALSVNLSPRQFRQPDFVAWMHQLLTEHAIDPAQLTLEITEGLFIGDVEEAISRMQILTSLGLHFSIDDFGTGYSSLAYLKRLPISELKIDKSFIQDAPTHPDDAALVETILSVARHMQLKVVAEGVETVDQAGFLAKREPQVILQGYLYGRPTPAEECLARWAQDGIPPIRRTAVTAPESPPLTACA